MPGKQIPIINPAGHPFQKREMKVPYKDINSIDYAGNFEDFLNQRPDGKPFCFRLGAKEPHRGYEKDSWKKDGRDLNKVEVQDFYPDNKTIRGDHADYAIEVTGVKKHPQMTGRSFRDALLSRKSGRLAPSREHTLFGKERHDIGRLSRPRQHRRLFVCAQFQTTSLARRRSTIRTEERRRTDFSYGEPSVVNGNHTTH